MTRTERLAKAEASAKEELARQRERLAKVQARQREDARKARDKRRYQVGSFADEAGLLSWDNATIAALFALVATLRDVPNPVGVLEGLLCETVSPVPVAVEESAAVACVEA